MQQIKQVHTQNANILVHVSPL